MGEGLNAEGFEQFAFDGHKDLTALVDSYERWLTQFHLDPC